MRLFLNSIKKIKDQPHEEVAFIITESLKLLLKKSPTNQGSGGVAILF